MTYRSKTKPWSHQVRAAELLLKNESYMLAFDMATGKSKIVVDDICLHGYDVSLIVCPKAVVDVWPLQFKTHAGRKVKIISLKKETVAKRVVRAQREIDICRRTKTPAVLIINYEAYWREPMRDFLLRLAKSKQLQNVVLDESHRIKAPGGKASWFAKALGKVVRRRIALTGTPMPHSPLDIYAQMRFVDIRVFGSSFNRFKNRYAILGGYGDFAGKQVVGFRNLEDLNKRFYTKALRVCADDVLDLPESIHTTRTCQLVAKTMKIYRELEDAFVAEVEDGTITAANALVKMLRLHQMAGGFLKLDDEECTKQIGEEKFELLDELIADFPPDEPLIIFCKFRSEIEGIKIRLSVSGISYAELSGKANDLKLWQDGVARILIAQIQSGKEGVDLTRARYSIYYSMDFSLGAFEQSKARIRRTTQASKTVFYYYLVAEGTVDEKIFKALQEKKDVVDSALRDYSKKPYGQ